MRSFVLHLVSKSSVLIYFAFMLLMEIKEEVIFATEIRKRRQKYAIKTKLRYSEYL